jgi:hypothetical protein
VARIAGAAESAPVQHENPGADPAERGVKNRSFVVIVLAGVILGLVFAAY